jgi:hypothetical protein
MRTTDGRRSSKTYCYFIAIRERGRTGKRPACGPPIVEVSGIVPNLNRSLVY